MSFDTLLADEAVIVRPATTVDRYGNTTLDWATATSTTVKTRISQRSADELATAGGGSQGRTGEQSTWIMYVEPDVTISAADHVEWEGDTFEVVGKPLPAKTPRGLHHYECQLRLIVG